MFLRKDPKKPQEERSIKSLYLPIAILAVIALLYVGFSISAVTEQDEAAGFFLKLLKWTTMLVGGGG